MACGWRCNGHCAPCPVQRFCWHGPCFGTWWVGNNSHFEIKKKKGMKPFWKSSQQKLISKTQSILIGHAASPSPWCAHSATRPSPFCSLPKCHKLAIWTHYCQLWPVQQQCHPTHQWKAWKWLGCLCGHRLLSQAFLSALHAGTALLPISQSKPSCSSLLAGIFEARTRNLPVWSWAGVWVQIEAAKKNKAKTTGTLGGAGVW